MHIQQYLYKGYLSLTCVCWCYVNIIGEYDVCDVTLSVHPHRVS
jgi:hypothetical protein